MALSDLTVFSNTVRTASIELLRYNIDLFNEASRGTITLGTEAHPGDYFDSLQFQLLAGMVKSRNPRGTGTIATKVLRNIQETQVKVGAGTYPVDVSNAQWAWIQQDPVLAGQAIGESIAQQVIESMVNNAVAAVSGAIAAIGASVNMDAGGTYASQKPISYILLAEAAGLFGDQSGKIRAWIMHSTNATTLLVNALTNNERLFNFGNVVIQTDAVGRPIIVTDNVNLKVQSLNTGTSTPPIYAALGLQEGAVNVMQQDDFHDNWDERNGNENILRTYQSEWSYMMGVKGCSWDKVNGGVAPNSAALAIGTNWDQYVTSFKDTPGVRLTSNS